MTEEVELKVRLFLAITKEVDPCESENEHLLELFFFFFFLFFFSYKKKKKKEKKSFVVLSTVLSIPLRWKEDGLKWPYLKGAQ